MRENHSIQDPEAGSPNSAVITQALENIDFTHILRVLWIGKFWIVLTGLLGLFWGGYTAFVTSVPVYTATATIALESRSEQVVNVDSVVGGLAGNLATMNTEVEVLRSRGLAEKTVRKLDLIEDPEFNGYLSSPSFSLRGAILGLIRGPSPAGPPPSEEAQISQAVNALLGRLSINNLRQSFVFQITVTTVSPRKSALIANTVAEMYIQDQLDVKFRATQQATEWLAQRVTELEAELETALEAVKTFNASADLISPEALEGLNQRLKSQRDRLQSAQEALAVSRDRFARMEQARDSGDLAQMISAASDPLLTRAFSQVETEADRERVRVTFDSIMARSRDGILRSQSQIEALINAIAEIEQEIAKQSNEIVELQQLEREAEASRLIYESFLSRLKETAVQQGIQKADSRILSVAVPPGGPSAPRKSRLLALWMMLGLMVGGGFVLLREMLHNAFRTTEEIEAITGYPVIGQIPSVPRRRRRNVLEYIVENPTSMTVEAIRNMRTSVLMSNIDRPPQIIMSTSPLPSEGKTTTSIALAHNLGGLNKRILLVECDIRRRIFSHYFEVADPKGILAVLSKEVTLQEAVHRSEFLGVDVLFGEKSQANAADVFSSDAFSELIREARNNYDYIILDTPPVLIVPDARVIGQHADAILISVKWNTTPKKALLECIKNLQTVNLHITGLVLGQINMRHARKYSAYGSYSYYGKGYYNH